LKPINLAVIPARGGSKRIPRKNIKKFNGKPMLAWAIEAAKRSQLFDEVVVSTDDQEIASIGRDWGASTPFIRPRELADDFSPTLPVVQHCLEHFVLKGRQLGYVCCLYPCTPFVKSEDLVGSLDMLKSDVRPFVYAVGEYPHPIQRALRLESNGALKFLNSSYELKRTQDLEVFYHDLGQFYWAYGNDWLNAKTIHSNALGYTIQTSKFIDIDTMEDWHRAEFFANYIGLGRED